MPRVLAVNNYPTAERFVRLTKCLEGNGATVVAAPSKDASSHLFNSYDGVVLSGSPDMLSTPRARKKYAAEMGALSEARVPVLGVCFGHQLMASAFGAKVVKVPHVLRFVETKQTGTFELFRGMGRTLRLLESREEVVESLPPSFERAAKSETTDIAAMVNKKRRLIGVQSHPERYTAENPDGNTVIGNFVRWLE